MRIHTTSAFALATAFAVTLSFGATAAHADGMPYKPKKVQAEVPLEKAIDEVQNKEPPVAVAPAAATTSQIEQYEPAQAAEPPPVPESRIVEVQPNTSFFGLSVGMYDAATHGQQAASINFEYQPGTKIAGFIQPLFGALATTDGSMMGYGGVGFPFHLGERVFMMPSVAVGAYKEGAGVDLGQTLAFRVGTELAYEFDNKSRLGVNVHAITNGESLQRRDRTEVISLVYTRPLNVFSGNSSDN